MSQRIPTTPIHHDGPSAEKKKIYTRFVTGFYQRIRVISMYSILVLFFVLPFLRWDGRQALWLDIGSQHFYIFGMTFMPQDLFFLAWLFIMAAFALFMVTVFAGRVFCGYTCPQTIWVHLYMQVEKFIEGNRNKRMKLDKAPLSASKIAKRSAKHTLWLLIAFFTALTFVSYIVSTDVLYHSWKSISLLGMNIPFPDVSGLTWVFIGIFTFATYMNAGWMREQMCFYICPYGRFQSVMFDRDTLIVSYDTERGEPRGARKKSADTSKIGDCIDCKLCVQVCPTGIDIRDGLQMECIQCAACVDACNSIMKKMNYPTGLVRYTTERQLVDKKKSHVLRLKLLAYVVLLSVLVIGFVWALSGRVPIELDVMRDRNQLYFERMDGLVENAYTIKITNKTQDEHEYKLTLIAPDALRMESRWQVIPLEPGESFDVPVSVVGKPDTLPELSTPIKFNVISIDDKHITATSPNVFNRPKTATK